MPTTLANDTVLDRRPRLKEACRQLQGMAEELGAEAKLPTLVELRSQLGISMQTLSDAVRELEKRNVLSSVHGVGIYVKKQNVRAVTGNVGFVAPYNMRPEQNLAYWGSVLAGMRSAARDRGYHLLLIDDGNAFEHWEKIDGAVLCDTHDPRDPSPGMPAVPQNFPSVTILNMVPGIASITTNDFEGVYQLTKHLIELGHQRIAYLATDAGLLQLEQRKEGYTKALLEAGLEFDPRYVRELRPRPEWKEVLSWYPQAGEFYTQQWLDENWSELGCTALMAQNDETARGAIKAFRAAGMEVPRDVSVTGFDGLPSHPDMQQLATMHVPLFDVGEQAIKSLLDYLDDTTQLPQDVRLPVSFVQGQTTAAPSEDITQ